MRYKVCSVRKVIAGFYRKFRPGNHGFAEDAIEWVADAIEIMGCGGNYLETHKDLDVVNYKVEIPCGLESLLHVVVNGTRVRRNNGIAIKYKNSCQNSIPYCEHTYKINVDEPNTITLSFETGCVRLYYLSLPLDCAGYPMVIDSAKYKNALEWYILMCLCSRGFRHPVFNYQAAKAEWEVAYPRAQNDCKSFDLDQAENFKHHYLGVIRELNRADEFFRTNGQAIGTGAYAPGSLLQTFQVLGNSIQ